MKTPALESLFNKLTGLQLKKKKKQTLANMIFGNFSE